MTTPQDPAKRRKQKIRRTKRLEAWRAERSRGAAATASPAENAARKPAK